MESNDPDYLIDRVIIGEASAEDMERLSVLLDQNSAQGSHLAKTLREELALSEWIRQALGDYSSAEACAPLRESLDHQDLTLDEWFNLARDGELSPSAATELARNLLNAPEEVATLRAALIEEEWISQIVSRTKSEEAFVNSLVTRMWAETREDHFVKDFTKKLDSLGQEEKTNVIPFPSQEPRTKNQKPKIALIAGLAAAVAIGAFLASTYFEGNLPFSFSRPKENTVAKISKTTDDVIWSEGAQIAKDGSITKGRYKLEAGAISLSLSDGNSLAVQGPAVFEVDARGEAVLYEGIALATRSGTPSSAETFGIGLSSKNVRFSEGAITVGLDARSPESTEAVVFCGHASVCLVNEASSPGALSLLPPSAGSQCRNVFEFESIKADHTREKFVDVPYNPRAFAKAWELVSGIEKNLGDIVIELPGIASNTRKSEAGEIRVFLEKERFQAKNPVEVDATTPGFFASSDAEAEGKSLAANGEEMRSYLLQLWPGNSPKNNGEIEASLTFDHPVVGLIFSSERLWESDQMVGASTQHLTGNSHRGLDSMGDQILLSEDGRTLKLKLKGTLTDIDQVRVFVTLK